MERQPVVVRFDGVGLIEILQGLLDALQEEASVGIGVDSVPRLIGEFEVLCDPFFQIEELVVAQGVEHDEDRPAQVLHGRHLVDHRSMVDEARPSVNPCSLRRCVRHLGRSREQRMSSSSSFTSVTEQPAMSSDVQYSPT